MTTPSASPRPPGQAVSRRPGWAAITLLSLILGVPLLLVLWTTVDPAAQDVVDRIVRWSYWAYPVLGALAVLAYGVVRLLGRGRPS